MRDLQRNLAHVKEGRDCWSSEFETHQLKHRHDAEVGVSPSMNSSSQSTNISAAVYHRMGDVPGETGA